MVADLDPLMRVPCTYPGCAQSFDTTSEMKAHKVESPTHFYCKKCDVDCASWVDLTQHKVDAMAPFLHGKREDLGNPKHIVCEFCGQDFKSMGGRKRHREQNHQADQHIVCPGCQSIFVRAALMIEHLERNHCTQISAIDFSLRMHTKFFQAERMKNLGSGVPSHYRVEQFSPDTTAIDDSHSPGVGRRCQRLSENLREYDDQFAYGGSDTDGGVSLLDKDDDLQSRGRALMKSVTSAAESVPVSTSSITRVSYKEKWPKLPEACKKVPIATMSTLSLVPSNDVHTPGMTSNASRDSAERASSRKGKSTELAKHNSGRLISAWQHGGLSIPTMFPNAKPTSPDAAASKFLAQQDAQANVDVDLLDQKYWLINSPDYNPATFFNALIDSYCCPVSPCISSFESASELGEHMLWAHCKTRFECPACLRVFGKPSALVAHAESGGHCKISQADQFAELLMKITGDLLEARQLPESILVRPGTKSAKVEGIMTTKYKARVPEDPFATKSVKW